MPYKSYKYIATKSATKKKSIVGFYRVIKGHEYQITKSDNEGYCFVSGFLMDNEGISNEQMVKELLVRTVEPFVEMPQVSCQNCSKVLFEKDGVPATNKNYSGVPFYFCGECAKEAEDDKKKFSINLCQKCGGETLGCHGCDYDEEITPHDVEECNCCENCRRLCAMDI